MTNKRVDLSPKKLASYDVRASRVGLWISISPALSWPIFAASVDLVSSGGLPLNREKGTMCVVL